MNSAILRMLMWEFCRRGWWRMLNALLAVSGVAIIVYSSLLRTGPLDPQSGRTLHFVLLSILFVTCGGAAWSAQGVVERFYLLPLPNRLLAATVMLPGMMSVGFSYVFAARMLNSLFPVAWPLWGPGLFLAAALGGFQTVSYLTKGSRPLQLILWCLLAVLFEAWLIDRYGGGHFLQPKAMWSTVTFRELLSMGAMVCCELLVATWCIARERRGDSTVLSLRPARLALSEQMAASTQRPFRNAAAAQFWFEWQQKGWILPGIFAAFAVFMLTGYSLHWFKNGEYELLHGCAGFGIGLAPISLIAGLVLGHANLPQGSSECGGFLATRPLTNSALSAAVFKMEGVSLLLTWSLWLLGTLSATGLLYLDQGVEPVWDLWTQHGQLTAEFSQMGPWFGLVIAMMCLLAAWISLTLATSLALSGRQQFLVAVVSGSVPIFLTALFLAGLRSEGHALLSDEKVRLVIGGSAILGTLATFALTLRRKLIGRSTCQAVVVGWSVLCLFASGVMWRVNSWTLPWLIFAAGALVLPYVPLAAGPLAFSWNRHR